MKLEKETALYNKNAIKNDLDEAKSNSDYFWFESGGEYPEFKGAHITQIPAEDFIDTPSSAGGNIWIDSNEISLRNGTRRQYSTKNIDHPIINSQSMVDRYYNGVFNENDPYFMSNDTYWFPCAPIGDHDEFTCWDLVYMDLYNFSLTLPGIASGQPVYEASVLRFEDINNYENPIELYRGPNRAVYAYWSDQADEFWFVLEVVGLRNYTYELHWDNVKTRFHRGASSSSTILGPYLGDDQDPPLLGCKSRYYDDYPFSVSHDGKVYANDIYLENHDSEIGTIYFKSTTNSVPYGSSTSAGWKHMRNNCEIDLNEGTYLITSMVRIDGTVSGEVYGLAIGYNQNNNNSYYGYSRTSFRGNGATIQLTTQYITKLTDEPFNPINVKFHPAVYIGSGGANVNVTNRMIRAVRIV